MTRAMIALLLFLALLTTPSEAGFNGTLPLPGAAEVGPIAPPPALDTPWSILFQFDASAAVGGNNYLCGVAYAGGYFWATGGGQSLADPTDNLIYKFTPTGVLVATYPQPNIGDGFGFHDLTFDSTYLYGGGVGPEICAFDLNGQMVPTMNIPKPMYCVNFNGIAYNPTLDRFWAANGSDLWEFDRSGHTFWQGYSGEPGYVDGLAFDYSSYGPWLWMFCSFGIPNSTIVKFNPITHVNTGENHAIGPIGGLTGQNSAGLDITREYDASLWTLVGMASGTQGDHIFVDELHPYLNPLAPAAPTSLQVANNGPALNSTVTWTNPTLNASGDPLLSINAITIKRNNVPHDTLTGDPGQAMTYLDDVPAPGYYSYQVRCINEYGIGPYVSDWAWIGLDAPDYVTNLAGVGVGTTLSAQLTWTNPTTGQHNGYFTPASITGYVIKRYDQIDQLQATFYPSGLLTSYMDNTVPEPDWYKYSVAAVNSTDTGYVANTDLFQVGPAEWIPIPYDWVEISDLGENTGITQLDQNVGPFELGFIYMFYGLPFDSIRICSNGFASFTSTSTSHDPEPIPDPEEPNNLVAPMWQHLDPQFLHGSVWFYPDYANQRFIIEWDSLVSGKDNLPNKFEAILYSNGYIDFMYQIVAPYDFDGRTIGIENADGSAGVMCSHGWGGPFQPEDSTGVRILTQHVEPSDIELTLTPLVSPILIPATGGSFSYYVMVNNAGTTTQNTGLWIKAILPNGSVLCPVVGPVTVSIPPGTRAWFRTQNVPGSAPSGEYTYIGMAGVYPDTIWSQDSIQFTKLPSGDGSALDNWNNWGDSFTEEMATASTAAPLAFAMMEPYPNPFNPTTAISFELRAASYVSLKIYDTSGRLVTTLVEGWREAGEHEVVFDGSGLASGVYLCRLQAGDYKSVQKIILLK